MNTEIADTDPHPAVTPTTPVVAVVAEHDILDAAVVALVEKLGFVAVVHDVDSPSARAPGYAVVVITRSRRRYAPLGAMPGYRLATIVGIGVSDFQPATAPSSTTATGVSQLHAILADAARHHPQLQTSGASQSVDARKPVHLTQRELTVLRTYVFGETICATARAHTIAESTVREHYRRVKERYARAGRPVNNKAQLLLALVSDGWLTTGGSGETGQRVWPTEWRPPSEGE